MFLMVRNPGVADAAAFTLLGASTTRYTPRDGTIGCFGSGSKNAAALLLRKSINPVIICGNLKMEFYTKPRMVGGHEFNQICVKYSGKDVDGTSRTSNEELNITTEWGVQDWTKASMAFREFVANAIDGATIAGGSYKDVEFEVVDKPRAKAGYTAVFLPLTPEIQECWTNVGTVFLHFSHPHLLNQKILPKLGDDKNVLIYKKGVLVSKVEESSVFDYNLNDELTLDESRNAQVWDVRYSCSKAISTAEPVDIVKIIKAQMDGRDVFENRFETHYIHNEWESADVKKVKADKFQTAFKAIAGDNAVLVSGKKGISDFVERKGFTPVKVEGNWFRTLEKFGISTEDNVLEGLEREGKQVSEATQEMLDCTAKVWAMLEAFKLTNGKPMPKVKGFMEIMSGESQTRGYYILGGDTIYLHTHLGVGKMMFKVALEEVIHYLTQAIDGSRDLQSYLFDLVTEMSY